MFLLKILLGPRLPSQPTNNWIGVTALDIAGMFSNSVAFRRASLTFSTSFSFRCTLWARVLWPRVLWPLPLSVMTCCALRD